jgi:hypothetical protein
MAREIRLTIALTPKTALFLLTMALLAAVSVELGSETLNMTTTYPSPAGIYRTLITTQTTTLARDKSGSVVNIGGGGNTSATLNVYGGANVSNSLTVDGTASVLGNVGIGTSGSPATLYVFGGIGISTGTPVGLLDVNGAVTLRGTTTLSNGAILSFVNGASLKDSNGSTGSANQILGYNGSGLVWKSPSGGATLYQCPNYGPYIGNGAAGWGSCWNTCNGQVQTGSTCNWPMSVAVGHTSTNVTTWLATCGGGINYACTQIQ